MDQATENLIREANEGDVESAFAVAMLYKDGTREIHMDLQRYSYYIKSVADAETDEPKVAPRVALASLLTARGMKHGSEGFARDEVGARRYYLRAAVGVAGEGSGHPLAARKVGEWLTHGTQGFPKDPQRGWRLLLAAADKDDGPALMQVAEGYLSGTYGPVNIEQGGKYLYRYIMRSRNEKELLAYAEYGALEKRSIVLYTDYVLNRDPKRCIDFLTKLPQNFGAPWMQAALLGWFYTQLGEYEVAMPYLRRGLRYNDSACAGCMGLMYAYGLGVPQDFSQAKFYWEIGADGGDANCKKAVENFPEVQKRASGKGIKNIHKNISAFLQGRWSDI